MRKILILLGVLLIIIPFSYKIYKKYSKEQINKKLFIAAENNDIQQAEKLIKLGANVNYTEHFVTAKTPLLVAITRGNPEMVEFLMKNGASANKISDFDYYPLDQSKLIRRGGYIIYSSDTTNEQWKMIQEKQNEIIAILRKYNAPESNDPWIESGLINEE